MKIALVRLREAGQSATYKADENICVNDYVIVEADRGTDYGEVVELSEVDSTIPKTENDGLLKSIVRKASAEDLQQIANNKKEANEAMQLCSRKISEYKINMKLVDAEYSFDKKKIVFYFTAD